MDQLHRDVGLQLHPLGSVLPKKNLPVPEDAGLQLPGGIGKEELGPQVRGGEGPGDSLQKLRQPRAGARGNGDTVPLQPLGKLRASRKPLLTVESCTKKSN